MYFPYLRGKTYELAVLDDCIELIQRKEQIVPIIEPVKKDVSGLTNKLIRYVQRGMPIILITNPKVGELSSKPDEILDIVAPKLDENGSSHILGFIITEKTSAQDIHSFINRTMQNKVCFIHAFEYIDPRVFDGHENIEFHIFINGKADLSYQRKFIEPQKIIIEDGFTVQTKNALYPNDENFSELNKNYQQLGYMGFGDYLIVGKDFKLKGGPAYAVVIHITYQKETGGIGIRHFVSDRTDTDKDTAGKFLEALSKLMAEKNKNSKIIQTMAMNKYSNLFDRRHFPNLGYVKKLSMEHHIELMATLI